MAGAFHELSKEPNSHVLFEASLKFMGERLIGKAPGLPVKPFAEFNPQQVRYYRSQPLWKRRKFQVFCLVLAYLVVGLFLARKFGMKRLLLTWPSRLFKK